MNNKPTPTAVLYYIWMMFIKEMILPVPFEWCWEEYFPRRACIVLRKVLFTRS